MNRMSHIRAITENTLIPLSLVIVVVGGIAWLTTLHSDVKASVDAIARVESKQDEYLKTVQYIDSRLSRIEGKLDGSK